MPRRPWSFPGDFGEGPMRADQAARGPAPVTSGPIIGAPRTPAGGAFTAPSRGVAQREVETDATVAAYSPHAYANPASLNLTPANGESSLFLNRPPGLRNFLLMRNGSALGGANLFIDFDREASLVSTLVLEPGQSVLFDIVVPQSDLYVFADAANATFSFSWSNI